MTMLKENKIIIIKTRDFGLATRTLQKDRYPTDIRPGARQETKVVIKKLSVYMPEEEINAQLKEPNIRASDKDNPVKSEIGSAKKKKTMWPCRVKLN